MAQTSYAVAAWQLLRLCNRIRPACPNSAIRQPQRSLRPSAQGGSAYTWFPARAVTVAASRTAGQYLGSEKAAYTCHQPIGTVPRAASPCCEDFPYHCPLPPSLRNRQWRESTTRNFSRLDTVECRTHQNAVVDWFLRHVRPMSPWAWARAPLWVRDLHGSFPGLTY